MGKPIKQCARCGRKGFVWGKLQGNWRLFQTNGVLHVCQEGIDYSRQNAERRLERLAKLEGWLKRNRDVERQAVQAAPQQPRTGRVAPSPAHMHRTPSQVFAEWSGFKWTPLCQAIQEFRSSYKTDIAAADTRRFNDLEVFELDSSGPEFQFTE